MTYKHKVSLLMCILEKKDLSNDLYKLQTNSIGGESKLFKL